MTPSTIANFTNANVLEPDAAIPSEQFFASPQAKHFTDNQGSTTCAQEA